MPNEKPVHLEAVSEVRDLLTPNPTPQKQPTSLPQSVDEYFNAAAEGADSPLDALTFRQVRAYFDASSPEHSAARALMGQPALSAPPPSSPTTPLRAPGRDSVQDVFIEYLERSQKYSADLERQQQLAGQFTGADTGVGVPEMQPSLLSKGAPVGTYGPPTKVPPLPRLPLNLEELRNFTGWNEPGFLESLIGASGWMTPVDVALKAFNAPFEALYNLIQNIPVKTEGEQAAREALAKATYIGALLYAPGDLGLSKGIKALNRAAREAKAVGEVAQRAAEIARGQ